MNANHQRYRGRFAPSPTGPLHFGSLLTAVGSYLDARAAHGEWLLRIEDVDADRTVPGAADGILRTLEAFGFGWDGAPVYQSQRLHRYREVLDWLIADGFVYPCSCTRREVADLGRLQSVDGGHVYPGTCRHGLALGQTPRAWRVRVPEAEYGFDDRVQGLQSQCLARDVGDFVLLRADGQFSYQLAVVVDDADTGITDIVRGADLLDSTPRQRFLQMCLAGKSLFPVGPTPRYAHLPVATNARGEKWSKQTMAPAISSSQGVALLVRALRFLGHVVPPKVEFWTLDEFWTWAIAHWQMNVVPKCRSLVGG